MNALYFVLGIALGALATLATDDWRKFEADQQPLVEAHRHPYFNAAKWQCE